MKGIQNKGMQILALLPGVDCKGHGGCGYETCEACAKAIAETGNVTLCPACRQEKVDAMAQVLGVAAVVQKDMIAFLRCAGDAAGKERLSGLESCDVAKEAGLLHSECQWGCFGIGSCMERCEFGAMSVEDGKLVIDEAKCTGCMA